MLANNHYDSLESWGSLWSVIIISAKFLKPGKWKSNVCLNLLMIDLHLWSKRSTNVKYRRCAAPPARTLYGEVGVGVGIGCLTELCRTKALWYLLHNGFNKRPLFSRFSEHFLPLRTSWVFNFIVSITHNSHHFPSPNTALLSVSLCEQD